MHTPGHIALRRRHPWRCATPPPHAGVSTSLHGEQDPLGGCIALAYSLTSASTSPASAQLTLRLLLCLPTPHQSRHPLTPPHCTSRTCIPRIIPRVILGAWYCFLWRVRVNARWLEVELVLGKCRGQQKGTKSVWGGAEQGGRWWWGWVERGPGKWGGRSEGAVSIWQAAPTHQEGERRSGTGEKQKQTPTYCWACYWKSSLCRLCLNSKWGAASYHCAVFSTRVQCTSIVNGGNWDKYAYDKWGSLCSLNPSIPVLQ